MEYILIYQNLQSDLDQKFIKKGKWSSQMTNFIEVKVIYSSWPCDPKST